MGKFCFLKTLSVMFIGHILLSSCSAYHFKKNKNPLAIYGIKSLDIPLFSNQSILPRVSEVLTSEVHHVLSKYKDMKIYSYANPSADGILVGIISTKDKRYQVYKTASRAYPTAELADSFGQGRKAFYLPQTTNYDLSVRLILIKGTDIAEVSELLQNGYLHSLKFHPKVMWEEEFGMTGGFARGLFDTLNPDSGGVVNYTNSEGNFEKSLRAVAKELGRRLKEEVLDVF